MATSPEEISYIKGRLSEFCSAIVEVSKRREPAYTNAANGFFRDELVADKRFSDSARGAEKPLAGDAKALFDIYAALATETFSAFQSNTNHKTNIATDPKLLLDVTNILKDVVKVVTDLVTVYLGSPNSKAQAIASLEADAKKLMDDINSKTAILDGENANGNISIGVNGAASKASAALKGRSWDEGSKKVADVLAAASADFAALDTKGHDPWLKPEWQVRFEYIAGSLNLALS